MSCILVIHKRSDIRLSLSLIIRNQGYEVVEAENINQARDSMALYEVTLVILDIDDCTQSAEAKLMESFIYDVQLKGNTIRIIALTSWRHKELVDKASQQGVNDFLSKPWKNQQVIQSVSQQFYQAKQLYKHSQLQKYLKNNVSEYYAWQSHSMQKIFRQVNSLNVKLPFYVLSGSANTGKKAVAEYIHQAALRKNEFFITLDCHVSTKNNLTSPWLEAMEFIENGTLVLENIEKLPIEEQENLVNYLLEKQSEEIKTGCIVLMCNQKLSDLFKANSIASTLYKILKINEINLPDIKYRTDDIVPFIRFIFTLKSAEIKLSNDAEAFLQQYHWPLNIKELIMVAEQLIALDLEHITAADLRINVLSSKNHGSSDTVALPMLTLEEAEISLLQQALQVTSNNIPQAAELLGLTKSAMYRRVEKYALVKK